MAKQDAKAAAKTGEVDIITKSPASQRAVTIKRNLGATLAESVELFGEEVVHSHALAQIEIRIQGAVRNVLDSGHKVKKDKDGNETKPGDQFSEEDAAKAGEEYTPGVQKRSGAPKKDPIQALKAKVASGEMTKEQVIAALRAELGE